MNTFTKNTPESAGWYWLKLPGGSESFKRVFYDKKLGALCVRFDWNGSTLPVRLIAGEWRKG